MINDHHRLRMMPAGEAPIDAKSWVEALPWWFRQRPTPGYEQRKWWSLEHRLGSWDMEMGSHLDVFLFITSLLLFFGSQPGTNVVGMGFTTCHRMWSFPVRQNRRTVALYWPDWSRVSLDCTSTYAEHVFNCFLPFLFLYRWLQPRGSAPKKGDDVTAGG